MLFQLRPTGFGYINGYGYPTAAPENQRDGVKRHPGKMRSMIVVFCQGRKGNAQSGLTRLAQARQNRPGKGELDLTDILI